jgi:small GTP-binding protein
MTDKMKVCMLGATAVGKTSLVGRFLSSTFHERYATTIGVKIQARRVQRGEQALELVLWDLSGEDEFQSIQPAYLSGAAGYLLVVDGTRRQTLDTAISLQERAHKTLGDVPFLVVMNKADLQSSWDLDTQTLQALEQRGWRVAHTSAKTGEGVDATFQLLADAILDRQRRSWT